jgi:hypothetical protein
MLEPAQDQARIPRHYFRIHGLAHEPRNTVPASKFVSGRFVCRGRSSCLSRLEMAPHQCSS